MPRRSTKKFDYGKGIYYFNINKGHHNSITIKRVKKEDAIHSYINYLRTHGDKCEWLGRWNGKEFVETDIEKLLKPLQLSID